MSRLSHTRCYARLTLGCTARGASLWTGCAMLVFIVNGRVRGAYEVYSLAGLLLAGFYLAAAAERLRTRRFMGYLRSLPLGRERDVAGAHAFTGGVAVALGAIAYLADLSAAPAHAINQLGGWFGAPNRLPVEGRPWGALNLLVTPFVGYWTVLWTQVSPRARWLRSLGQLTVAVPCLLLFLFSFQARRACGGSWGDPHFITIAGGEAALFLAIGVAARFDVLRRLARCAVDGPESLEVTA